MKQFKDFDIKPTIEGYVGNSIDIDRILNQNIIIRKFSIAPSKKKEGTNYLTIQIEIDGELRVIFTGSKYLMDMISRVPPTEFPFQAKIERKNDRHFELA